MTVCSKPALADFVCDSQLTFVFIPLGHPKQNKDQPYFNLDTFETVLNSNIDNEPQPQVNMQPNNTENKVPTSTSGKNVQIEEEVEEIPAPVCLEAAQSLFLPTSTQQNESSVIEPSPEDWVQIEEKRTASPVQTFPAGTQSPCSLPSSLIVVSTDDWDIAANNALVGGIIDDIIGRMHDCFRTSQPLPKFRMTITSREVRDRVHDVRIGTEELSNFVQRLVNCIAILPATESQRVEEAAENVRDPPSAGGETTKSERSQRSPREEYQDASTHRTYQYGSGGWICVSFHP